MSKHLRYIVFFLVMLLGMVTPRFVHAQGTAAISSVSDSSLCPGDSVYIGYSIVDSFNKANTMRVQLSNASGSFASGTQVIGAEMRYKGAGLIPCVIPLSTPAGLGYKVRMFADSLPYFSPPHSWDLHVYSMPVSGATSNSPLCAGDTLKLVDTGSTTNASYQWSGPFSYTTRDPVVPDVQLNSTGTYMLTATIGACVRQTFIVVLVDSTPKKPVISTTATACAGDSLKLNIIQSPNASYAWTGPAGFNPAIANPSIANVNTSNAGTYIVTATFFNGCFAKDTQLVAVAPAPANPSAILLKAPICTGDSLGLVVTTPTPGATYNWTGPLTSNLRDPVFYNVDTSNSGNYVVTVQLGICTARDTVAVVVNPIPVTPTTSFQGGCVGDTLTLIANSLTGGTYFWFDSLGYSASSGTGIVTRPNATLGFSGLYYVSVTSAAGCVSDTASLNVTITESPAIPVITSNSPVCAGRNLQLSASSATPGVIYTWTGPGGFSSSGQNISFAGIGTGMSGAYTVTAALGSCTQVAGTDVVIKPFNTPSVTISADPGVEVAKMTPITFRANAANAGTLPVYQWRKNGIDIPGATRELYNAIAGVDVADNDYVSVMVKSNAECPLPDSIASYVFAVNIKTDVSDVNVINDLHVYPNPAKEYIFVKGSINADGPVEFRIINVAGDVIETGIAYAANKMLSASIRIGQLSQGVYLLQLKAGEQMINLRFVVNN